MDKYGVRGIPTLLVMGKDGVTAVNKTARGDVMSKGLACIKEWREQAKQ